MYIDNKKVGGVFNVESIAYYKNGRHPARETSWLKSYYKIFL